MSRGAVVTVVVAVAIRSGAAAPEREPDTLPVPPVPAAASSATVELPAVPSFELAQRHHQIAPRLASSQRFALG